MTGSFTCHCGNTGVARTPNKNQHTKLTLEKKILLPLLPGFELTNFRFDYESGALTNKLFRLPFGTALIESLAVDCVGSKPS